MNIKPQSPRGAGAQRGFTRTDLLAGAVAIALLAGLILPTLRANSSVGRSTVCLGNMKRLAHAWLMYAEDHDGRLVHNLHGGDAMGGAGSRRFAPWASGWQDWGTTSDNTNTAFLFDPRYARLAPYLSHRSIHKCPADRFASPKQRQQEMVRGRSVSMNGTIGPANHAQNPGPVDRIYAQVLKLSGFSYPPPSEVFTFLDEHPDSINDPFFVPPQARGWIDIPGNLHHGAASLAFVDGRAELKMWKGLTRTFPVRYVYTGPNLPDGDPDLSWLSYHSARVSEAHY